MQKAIKSNYLPQGFYTMIELSHSGFTQTHYLVNNTKEIVHNGNTFLPYPFVYKQRAQGEVSSSELALSNIDKTVVQEIRRAKDTAPNENIKIKLYLAQTEKQKDGTLLSDVVYKGQYNIISFSINKDATLATINLDLSLGYNLSTLRFGNVNIFKNLGL